MLAADAHFCTVLACRLELFVAATLHGRECFTLLLHQKPCRAFHDTNLEARSARLYALTVKLLTALQSDSMNKLQWCVLLLATAIVCTESHRLLSAESQSAGRKLAETDDNALEHQRILAELEEVHQLRERMLQQGEQSLM